MAVRTPHTPTPQTKRVGFPAPLLLAKTTLPQMPTRWVPRNALVQRLAQGIEGPLTLLSAPAGYGKTTLVLEWIHRQSGSVGWLSLDGQDDNFERFLLYLVASIQENYPEMGGALLHQIEAADTSTPEALLTLLLSDLQHIQAPYVLVIDDFHVVKDPRIHQGMSFFIQHLPANIRLVLVSREEPHFGLGRLRARGQLTQLGVHDLRFTEEEIQQYLATFIQLKLSPDELKTLNLRLDGWVTGLQLIACALQYTTPQKLIDALSGTNRYIEEFLSEEVLQQQPQEIQDFLVKTSILGRFQVDLCHAVTGAAQSAEYLRLLEQANLFLIPLDHERLWFRYHHLFAELLAHMLRKQTPESVNELHHKAGKWFHQHGWLDEAIEHLLAAEEYEEASDVVNEAARHILKRNDVQVLKGWLTRLPEACVQARPRLAIYGAWLSFVAGSWEEANTRLDDVEHRLARSPSGTAPQSARETSEEVELQHASSVVRAALMRYQVPPDTLLQSLRLPLQDLPPKSFFYNRALLFRLACQMKQSQDLPSFTQEAEQAISYFLELEDLHSISKLSRTIPTLYQFCGQLDKAEAFCIRVLEACDGKLGTNKARIPALGSLYQEYGGILYQRNQLEKAEVVLEESVRLGRLTGERQALFTACTRLAYTKYSRGDIEGARTLLQEVKWNSFKPKIYSSLSHSIDLHNQLLLLLGDVETVRTRMQEQKGFVEQEISSFQYLFILNWARIFALEHKHQKAHECIEQVLTRTKTQQCTGALIEGLRAQALVWAAQGERENALSVLRKALNLAKPERYIRVFVDEGAPMKELLQHLARQGQKDPQALYVKELLHACNTPTSHMKKDAKVVEGPAHIEHSKSTTSTTISTSATIDTTDPYFLDPLSERERAVLGIAASGLPYRTLAKKLFIAETTFKKHMSNIFSKLGAHNRTEAVSRARELGLFD